MVNITLQIDQGRSLLQNVLVKSLLYRPGDFPHIGVALADVHVIPNTDDVRHKGDHVGGLADRFTVGHLGFALIEILHGQAQQVTGAGKAESGPGGLIPEKGNP